MCIFNWADCDDVYRRGIRSSGVQLIKPGPAHSAVEVYCDIDIESGRGWSVLQQRHSGYHGYHMTI